MKTQNRYLDRLCTLKRAALVAALTMMTSAALAWGPGVHAYVGDQLNKKAGYKNVDEMYGSMAPDVINYMFSSPYLTEMYMGTHFNFLPMWQASQDKYERTLALGFFMHNNAYGADYSAHSGSLTLANHEKGYVIQKAEILAGYLKADPGYGSLNIPDVVTLEICHTMVEQSVELLMKQVDPTIGDRMVLAATQRNARFPELLARAYAGPFAQYFGGSETAAAQALVMAEAQFQQVMILQGTIMQQELPAALEGLAELNAEMAKAYLASLGASLPDEFPVKELVKTLIGAGMQLCANDFQAEVAATVQTVGRNLKENGMRFPQY